MRAATVRHLGLVRHPRQKEDQLRSRGATSVLCTGMNVAKYA